MKRLIKKAERIPLEHMTWITLFDDKQFQLIKKGIEEGLDVTYYADSQFDYKQMEQIYKGLKKGLDASWYAKPEFNEDQMYEIIWGLEKGLDVSWYAIPEYSSEQMEAINDCCLEEEGATLISKIKEYITPEWSKRKIISFILLISNENFDISELGDLSQYSDNDLRVINTKYRKGEDYSDLLK